MMPRNAYLPSNGKANAMKKLMPFIVASLLCSCGFMTPAKQYAGERLDPADIAVLKSYLGTPFGAEYHATITGYTKTGAGPNEQKTFGWPGFTDYPSEIHVLPGEYEVQIYCFKGFASHRPKKTLALQAGQTYLLTCAVQNGQAVVNVNPQTH